jgi:universal stress protein A
MTVYQHLLAAVDLGENSAKVLQQAAALAQACNARLTVLHVVNYTPPTDMDYVIPPEDEKEKELIEAASQQLQELLEREALTSGVETKVISGRPKIEITRVAEQAQADLIVVGAHGRHGLFALLGSTTDRVLHSASCNVLTVR